MWKKIGRVAFFPREVEGGREGGKEGGESRNFRNTEMLFTHASIQTGIAMEIIVWN